MSDTLFLMARPSFLGGAASVFDLGDTLTEYNLSETGEAADRAALWADWDAIARDLRECAQRYVGEVKRVEAQPTR